MRSQYLKIQKTRLLVQSFLALVLVFLWSFCSLETRPSNTKCVQFLSLNCTLVDDSSEPVFYLISYFAVAPPPFEVFTLPPHSIWIPYNSRWIPSIPYGICFGWDFTHFGHSIPLLFHMEFIWNGHIPSLFHHSIWNINMESTWNECEMMIWIPPGTNLEWSWIPYGFHLIPWNDHGLHRE